MKKTTILTLALLTMLFSFRHVQAETLPLGCTPGDNFSATTGVPCTLPDCSPGDLFSAVTGKPCSSGIYLPGCQSLNGYSISTGKKCDSMESSVSIVNNQTPTMPDPSTPNQPQTQSAPAVLPVITNASANNAGSTLSLIVKTDVPTTLTINYIDWNAIPELNDLPNTTNARVPVFLTVVSDPSRYQTYEDQTSTTNHLIPYSAFNFAPGGQYAFEVIATDQNGNQGLQNFEQYWGAGGPVTVGTFHWQTNNLMEAK